MLALAFKCVSVIGVREIRAVERGGQPHIIWGARPQGRENKKKRKREEKEKQEGKNRIRNEREKKTKRNKRKLKKKINDREKSPSQNKIIPIHW